MKKTVSIVLSVIMLLCVSSCGGTHQHVYTVENTDEAYLKAAATCESPAIYYYSCSCGKTSTETFECGEVDAANHIGDARTEYSYIDDFEHTVRTVCGGCGAVLLSEVKQHSEEKDDNCVSCGGNEHSHNYTEKVATSAYLKSIADCTSAAVYYYSCSCGEKGAETFEHGGVDADYHFGGRKIEFERVDDTRHRKNAVCLGCGAVRDSLMSIHDYDCEVCLLPGLYDANGNLIATWEALTTVYGMNVKRDYLNRAGDSKHYETCASSPYFIFKNNSELQSGTKLVIDWNVTDIGSYTFIGCTQLTSVVIPSGVYEVGAHAFDGCSNLKNLKLPDNLKTIGDYAFYNCKSLENINIPKNVESIGNYAFSGCENLIRVNFDTVYYKGILCVTFYNCSNLKEIVYSGSVENWNNIRVYSMKPAGSNDYIFWYTNTGEFSIYCTDGTIDKDMIVKDGDCE